MSAIDKLFDLVAHLFSKGKTSATPRLITCLIVALCTTLLITVAVAPIVAVAVALAGYRFPFPRIFDRTLVVTLFAILLMLAPRLELFDLLREGFDGPKRGIWHVFGGFGLSFGAVAALFGMARIAGATLDTHIIVVSCVRYLPAAILIALIEETFFRAFLLAGLQREIGACGALLLSSGIYAGVHVIRSPARFYVVDFEPRAGAETLAACAGRLLDVHAVVPMIGLFLLGMVLGQAFIGGRGVYLPLGLHAGFVMGAKSWRSAVRGVIPRWLAGPGAIPLLAAPAAWALSVTIFAILYLWSARNEISGRRPS